MNTRDGNPRALLRQRRKALNEPVNQPKPESPAEAFERTTRKIEVCEVEIAIFDLPEGSDSHIARASAATNRASLNEDKVTRRRSSKATPADTQRVINELLTANPDGYRKSEDFIGAVCTILNYERSTYFRHLKRLRESEE